MAARRNRIDYGIDESADLFIGVTTWPSKFLEDPAYALLRPLYEYTSPWRLSHDALSLYLHSQARRLGGRRHILFHFSNLALISEGFPKFNQFLLSPFDRGHILKRVFTEMELFLRWRFEAFTKEPWADYPIQEKLAAKRRTVSEKDLSSPPVPLSDLERKRFLKRALSKVPWQLQLQQVLEYESGIEGYHAAIIEKALKECPDLTSQKANLDLVNHIFSSPMPELTLDMGDKGYVVAEIPIMLGSHYLGKNVQKMWFETRGRKFYRILGNYARWDDAMIIIFNIKDNDGQARMFAAIKETQGLKSIGNWKRAQVDGEDYYLSLLVDLDLPERSFLVSEWEVNCPQLTILSKDTV